MKAWWAMAKLSAGSRQSLGASARMRILEHFSLDEIARQMLILIGKCWGKNAERKSC
jgi:hypothetical protein